MLVGVFQLVINLLGYREGHGHVADNDQPVSTQVRYLGFGGFLTGFSNVLSSA